MSFPILVAMFVGVALAQPTTTGVWTLVPPQATSNSVQVQQPINDDNSSVFKSNGNSVIPVKFALSTGVGPVLFESIGSNTATSDDFSALSFSPAPSITFSQITNLKAVYAFTTGNCHGGALRWSIGTAIGNVFIYYGAGPNFTDCITATQTGVNMISMTDQRFDTSGVAGGSFYDTYAHAMTLIGSQSVQFAALVLDAGWGGDQVVSLTSATVNDNTWTPTPSGTLTPTCALPLATIKVTKLSGATIGAVDEVTTIQPSDNNSQFRVVDCKYMYNLATSSLSGVGMYKIEVVIGGVTSAGNATFGLK